MGENMTTKEENLKGRIRLLEKELLIVKANLEHLSRRPPMTITIDENARGVANDVIKRIDELHLCKWLKETGNE